MPDATERKVLLFCTCVSACLSLAPQEFVSASVLLILFFVMYLAHVRITNREDALLRLLEQWAPEPGAPPEPSSEGEPAAPEGT